MNIKKNKITGVFNVQFRLKTNTSKNFISNGTSKEKDLSEIKFEVNN